MQKYGATFILMLIPKSDESFPFCPPFFSGGRNEQGFTLEFSFEKAERERRTAREREKRGVRKDTEILRGVGREIQETERGEEGKAENRVGEIRGKRERRKTIPKMQLVRAAGIEEMAEWTLNESV